MHSEVGFVHSRHALQQKWTGVLDLKSLPAEPLLTGKGKKETSFFWEKSGSQMVSFNVS